MERFYRTGDGEHHVDMLAKPDAGASCSDCDTWDDMDLGPVVAVVLLVGVSSWYVCRAHLDALIEEADAYAIAVRS